MTETPSSIHVSHLMDFVLGLLAPFLMTGPITDIGRARLAVAEAIAAYQAQTQQELVTIAQILGFVLTALDNLRLSLATDLSVSMKLKLRSNANALNRSAQHVTAALQQVRQSSPPPAPVSAEPDLPAIGDAPKPKAPAEPATQPPNPPPAPPVVAPQPAAQAAREQENRRHWAGAMRAEAARIQADRTRSPLANQKTNDLWIDVLTEVANELTTPLSTPVHMSKTDLMRSALMAGDTGFPPEFLGPAKPGAGKRRLTR